MVKYGLSGGKWIEHGSVEIPEVTGVTANDIKGEVVALRAPAPAPRRAKGGTLYRIADVSGANGTFSGIPTEIGQAPANEAFRGVAFAPGTEIGHGGTPPRHPRSRLLKPRFPPHSTTRRTDRCRSPSGTPPTQPAN